MSEHEHKHPKAEAPELPENGYENGAEPQPDPGPTDPPEGPGGGD